MMRRLACMFAAAALLAACATAPNYAPAASERVAGYSETQIESNRYFVTYRAPGGAQAQLIEDYALLRAAELTLQNNRDWFWVDRRTLDDADGRRSSGPSIGIGVGGGSYGGNSGASVGVGLNFPIGGGGPRATAATLEVRFGQGAKPDEPNAYDARATSANLRSRLIQPG